MQLQKSFKRIKGLRIIALLIAIVKVMEICIRSVSITYANVFLAINSSRVFSKKFSIDFFV